MAGKWTRDNFVKFDATNPEIYRMFCKFALQVAARREHFSAKCIFHRIRWESAVGTGGDYKIDDGWISHYARKYMHEYPQHDGFFELRQRRGSYH